MTEKESEALIFQIQSNYPNFYTRQSAEQADAMIKLWAVAFRDYDKNIVAKALMAVFMRKNDFPPTIAEVNSEIRKILRPETDVIGGEDAWEHISRLLGLFPLSQPYGLWSEDDKAAYVELKTRNPVLTNVCTKRALNAIGGFVVVGNCPLENLSILRSQFVKTYNEIANREVSQALLPPSLASEINAIKESRMSELTGNEAIKRLEAAND